MALKNATATFAVGKHVQFLENEVFLAGSGAALNADASKITFNGPVTVARNSNIRGAGGAFYLQMTNVTFNAAAEIHDNRASGWNGVSSGWLLERCQGISCSNSTCSVLCIEVRFQLILLRLSHQSMHALTLRRKQCLSAAACCQYAILASRGGGAICAAGSRILHNAPALYRDNTAGEQLSVARLLLTFHVT